MNFGFAHFALKSVEMKMGCLKLAYSFKKYLFLLFFIGAMAARPAYALVSISSVTLSPSTVPGGSYATATITFSAPLDYAAAAIYLASNNPAVAAVPTSINGVNGDTTEKFIIDVAPLQGTSNQTVTITATYGGVPCSAVLTVTPDYSTTVRTPSADAYVQNGTGYHDQNFGSSANIIVKTPNPPVAITRVSYITFDLTDVTVAPSRALLKLYFASAPTLADRYLDINIYSLPAASTWTETGITWDNAPNLDRTNIVDTGGTSLGTTRVLLQPGMTAVDMTSFVQAHLGQSGMLQIVANIVSPDQNGITFYSKEAGSALSPSLSFSYPATTIPTLTNLSLSQNAVISGGSITGTVTLNIPARATGALVNLKSSESVTTLNSTGTTVSSVTIAAGTRTANFSVQTASTVTKNIFATLSGSNNGWSQAATLAVAPSTETLTTQQLTATAGNKCVFLSWKELLPGLVRGYNIYRNNSATPLNGSAPIFGGVYADIGDNPSIVGLVNGQQYNYTVKVVNLQGAEVSSATTLIVTPTAAAPQLNWQVIPPANVSGNIDIFGSLRGMQGYLLVDGRFQGFTEASGADTTQQNTITLPLRTAGLLNGMHNLQIVGTKGTYGCATPVQQINVNNTDFSSIACDGILETDTSDVAGLQMTGPSGTQQWTVQVKDANNNIVRSWQLTSSNQTLKLAWDGKNSNNILVPEGSYTISTTAQTATSSQTKQTTVHVLYASPYALALLSYTAERTDTLGRQADLDFGNRIKISYANLQALNTNNKRYLVLGPEDFAAPDYAKLTNKIYKWLSTTVDIFFIASHGGFYESDDHVMDYTSYNSWLQFRLTTPNDSCYLYKLSVPEIMQGRNNRAFKFVFLHCCKSAGNGLSPVSLNGITGDYDIEFPDTSWATAFGILPNQNSGSAFLGWSSDVYTHYDQTGEYQRSVYFWWVAHFWELASNWPVFSAGDFANAKDQSTLQTQREWSWSSAYANPWDITNYIGIFFSRLVYFGDIEPLYLYQ